MTPHEREHLPFRAVNRPVDPSYRPGLQRHHLLPRQLLGKAAFAKFIGRLGAERMGFHDFRRNGMLLPASGAAARRLGLPLHRGPHRHYNEMVIERFGQIERTWLQAPGARNAEIDALARIDWLQRALRRRLLDPAHWCDAPLNRCDPALDFAHLDRMADTLWRAVQPA